MCKDITWRKKTHFMSLYTTRNVTHIALSLHYIRPTTSPPTNSTQPVVASRKGDAWQQSLGRVNPCDLSSAIKAQHLALWCQMRKQWSTSDRWKPLTPVPDPSTPHRPHAFHSPRSLPFKNKKQIDYSGRNQTETCCIRTKKKAGITLNYLV